jgi:membrane protease YdiL (CAAX protease family)
MRYFGHSFFNLSSLIDPSTTIPPVTEPVPLRPRPTWPAWVEILLCSGYPTQIVVGQLLIAIGVKPLLPNGSLSSTFVFLLSMVDTVALVGLILVFMLRRGERPADVFFGGRRPLGEIRAGILSVPLVIAVMIALMLAVRRFVPSLHNVPDNPLEGMIGTGINMWMFLGVVIVAGGVREELQRAFLLHRFRGDLGQPWMGLFITSLAFGMGHTLQGLDAAIVTGTLGAIWGAMYLARGGALAGMVSHALFNSGEVLRVLLK